MKSRAAAGMARAETGEQKAISEKTAGLAHGERRLMGVQTTGREYRNLGEPSFTICLTDNVSVTVRWFPTRGVLLPVIACVSRSHPLTRPTRR